MYTKENLVIHKITAKKPGDPSLACVAFYGNRTVATNSFSIVEVSADGAPRTKPELVKARIVKKFASDPDMFDNLYETLPKFPEKYPDVDAILSQSTIDAPDAVTVRVNPEYLEKILNILKSVNKNEVILTLFKDTPSAPILVQAVGGDGLHGKALVMPLNRT